MTDTALHVALCFDDNFWAPAYAVMRSICLATKRRSDLNFHLCHRKLTPEHIADLKTIETEFKATLHFHALDEMDIFKSVGLKAKYHPRLTHTIYGRLLFDHFLPKTITRLIYLDCDMYVRAPIEELAELDLKGKAIAAVSDPGSHLHTNGRDFRQKWDLFDTADPYFNSGMLVIDMDKWRALRVEETFAKAVEDGTLDRIYYDQDFLNLTFRHKWLRLDPRWNLIGPRKVHQALDPAILHYTGKRKPWNLVSGVAFARLYRHAMTNELYYRYMRYRMKKRLNRLIGRK